MQPNTGTTPAEVTEFTVPLCGTMSVATIEQIGPDEWECTAIFRDEDDGEVQSEEITVHPTADAARAHAEALRDTHADTE